MLPRMCMWSAEENNEPDAIHRKVEYLNFKFRGFFFFSVFMDCGERKEAGIEMFRWLCELCVEF